MGRGLPAPCWWLLCPCWWLLWPAPLACGALLGAAWWEVLVRVLVLVLVLVLGLVEEPMLWALCCW